MNTWLQQQAEALSIKLDQTQAERFTTYCALLQEWNKRLNLTSITETDAIFELHFLDSLTVATVCDMASVSSLIDVGTGAGFPGLALAISYPSLQVTLLESIEKKTKFLLQVTQELGLTDRVRVICGRAEALAGLKEHRAVYDLAVARAVARLNVLSEYCMPFVKVGGCFVAQKGPLADEELVEAKAAINLLGGEEAQIHRISLPGGATRSLVVIPKVRPTPGGYPRRIGLPSRKPII